MRINRKILNQLMGYLKYLDSILKVIKKTVSNSY